MSVYKDVTRYNATHKMLHGFMLFYLPFLCCLPLVGHRFLCWSRQNNRERERERTTVTLIVSVRQLVASVCPPVQSSGWRSSVSFAAAVIVSAIYWFIIYSQTTQVFAKKGEKRAVRSSAAFYFSFAVVDIL